MRATDSTGGVAAAKVVFVAGASRSGSTLLGRVLGAQPRAVHVGELALLWERGLQENQLCGCGVEFRACGFWRQVLDFALGTPDPAPDVVAELVDMRRHADYLPRTLGLGRLRRRDRRVSAYVAVLRRTIAAIHAVSGADVVVDSSKRPSHGMLLNDMPAATVRTVHLVRDSRAVFHSTKRVRRRPEVHWETVYMPTGRHAWRQALRWDMYNIASHIAGAGSDRRVLLRYEDFVADPLGMASDVLRRLGGGPDEISFDPEVLVKAERGDETVLALQPEHSVSGNPMRFEAGEVRVRIDDVWRAAISPADCRQVTWLSLPLLLRYGYV